MNETHENRLKRLRIRCWRRGTKEMDLLMGPYADRAIADLTSEELDAFEAMMDENDNDLYLWISGAAEMPAEHRPAIDRLKAFHKIS